MTRSGDIRFFDLAMSEGTVDVDETDGALLGLCEYCGELKVLDQLGRCSTPEVEGSPVHCYSCGEPSEFSSSQARKESHARCDACIAARRTQRFKPFEQLARHGEPASLLQAVEEINEEQGWAGILVATSCRAVVF